jgi:glycosyltransferase involved in cell wall biosynthesis
MSEPLVTVIMPTHDRGFCVTEAVQSVLAQTHTNLECIVIDDGSTDATYATLAASFGDDPRVRLLTQPRAGVSAARNRALAEASGTFVTFLDSDDLMTPTRIEHQLEFLDRTDFDMVMGRQELVIVGAVTLPGWLQSHPEWWTVYYHMSLLLPTQHMRAVGGFDESMLIAEDIDVSVRLASTGLRLGLLDEVVVTRRFFGDNLTYGLGDEPDDLVLLHAARRHLARRRAEAER